MSDNKPTPHSDQQLDQQQAAYILKEARTFLEGESVMVSKYWLEYIERTPIEQLKYDLEVLMTYSVNEKVSEAVTAFGESVMKVLEMKDDFLAQSLMDRKTVDKQLDDEHDTLFGLKKLLFERFDCTVEEADNGYGLALSLHQRGKEYIQMDVEIAELKAEVLTSNELLAERTLELENSQSAHNNTMNSARCARQVHDSDLRGKRQAENKLEVLTASLRGRGIGVKYSGGAGVQGQYVVHFDEYRGATPIPYYYWEPQEHCWLRRHWFGLSIFGTIVGIISMMYYCGVPC